MIGPFVLGQLLLDRCFPVLSMPSWLRLSAHNNFDDAAEQHAVCKRLGSNEMTNPNLAILIVGACWAATGFSSADDAIPQPPQIARFVAIDNVCAWPTLVSLPNGEIVAILHNRPSHGQMEGEIECWASAEGTLWERRGHPAPHETNTVRMNHAAGLANNGDLIVLCSGWTNEKQPQRPKQPAFRDDILRPWVCRSSDNGRTWTQHKEFTTPDAGWTEFIPFGPIFRGEGGGLHASCYGGEFTSPTQSSKTKGYQAWHFLSNDDGLTWRRTGVIGAKHNETSLLPLGGRRWLAAARIDAVELFRSDDDGATWQGPQRVTGRNEINAHLLQLGNGGLLLSYGSRVAGQFGVLARISNDEGQTWSAPLRLAESLESDCGYPSSVARSDGKIVTAWYAKRAHNHERYHMGVAVWSPPAK